MTIQRWVLLFFTILVSLTAAVALYGGGEIVKAMERPKNLPGAIARNVASNEIKFEVSESGRSMADFLLARAVRNDSAARVSLRDMKLHFDAAQSAVARLGDNKSSADDTYVPSLEKHVEDHINLLNTVVELVAQGRDKEALVLFYTSGERSQREIKRLCELIPSSDFSETQQEREYQRDQSIRAKNILFIISVGSLLVGGGGAFYVYRTIGGSLSKTTQEVIRSLAEIQAAAQEQVSTTQEQATSVSEITTTISELRETSRESADRARAVGEATTLATKKTQEGRESAEEGVRRVEENRERVERMGETILRLSEKMQQISEFVVVVNEISEQTKILALNASIEAAKAGEEGRGFAVVATQIRDLAAQSKESAARVQTLITDFRKSTDASVRETQEGARAAEQASQSIRKMGDNLQEIARTVEEISRQVLQVATVARQQEAGIEQVSAAMGQIDMAMKHSLSAAKKTQHSILEIERQVRSLEAPLGQV